MKKIVLFVSLLLLIGQVRLAAQTYNDLGTWVSAQAIKNFDKVFATVRIEHRSFENISATECAFLMAGAGYRFTPWLSGDLSYEHWSIPSANYLTMEKAVASLTASHKSGDLSVAFRAKYELAFSPTSEAPSHTFRWRLRTQYAPEGWSVRPYAMSELFTGVSNPMWIRSLHYLGAEIPLTQQHMLDLFYMYHICPQGGSTSSCHLLGAGYFFVF